MIYQYFRSFLKISGNSKKNKSIWWVEVQKRSKRWVTKNLKKKIENRKIENLKIEVLDEN